jgi:hypothetical protein
MKLIRAICSELSELFRSSPAPRQLVAIGGLILTVIGFLLISKSPIELLSSGIKSESDISRPLLMALLVPLILLYFWVGIRMTRAGSNASPVYRPVVVVANGIIRERRRGIVFSAVFIILVMLLSILLPFTPFGLASVAAPAMILLAAYLGALIIDLSLIVRRINKGAYGDNEAEAREIIAFILENRRDIDSSGGTFRIFDEQTAKSEIVEIIGVIQHA